MADLFWPGEHRRAPEPLLAAMVDVEQAWLGVLAGAGLTDGSDLTDLVAEPDLDPAQAEAGGNGVIPLVALLRERSGNDWVHRGLTSQDVVDTALVLLLRDGVADVRAELHAQVQALAQLAATHRDTPMVARTLGQWAVPTTFGLTAATWLVGLLDALDDLDALRFPVQLGGAAGTLAALVELGLDVDHTRRTLAGSLGLDPALPWHTNRRPVTRIGDALVAVTDAWGHIATDVVTLSRPEIGEVSEGTGGGSSTMPGKANPVLATLLRRAALTTPQLGATLHLAAIDQSDERAAGGWHAEWDTLRLLLHRTRVAAAQATDLLRGLQVHPERMAATAAAADTQVHGEQRSMAELVGHDPEGEYLGESGVLVDAILARAGEVRS